MSRLLQHLPPSVRIERFAPLLARCTVLELTAGEARTAERCAPSSIVVVEQGIAAVAAGRDGASRQMVVAIAEPGDLLAPLRQPEQLVALTDATLTFVGASAYTALLSVPEIAASLLERLVEAVSDRQQTIANFAAVNHCERLRAKLLQLARKHGRLSPSGIHLDLPLTHAFLAQTTGSSRETVTNALAALEEQGFLTRENRRYVLSVQSQR